MRMASMICIGHAKHDHRPIRYLITFRRKKNPAITGTACVHVTTNRDWNEEEQDINVFKC